MNKKLNIFLSLLSSVLIVLFLYIVVHEGGHAIVAIACGGKITDFSILGAHVSSTGGSYNMFTSSLLNVAGALLPLIVSFVYMVLYKRQIENIFYIIFSLIFSIAPLGSLLAWVFVPILYMSGNAPVNDDATKFIVNSGWSPWAVIISAVILLLCGCYLAYKKGIVKNYFQLCKGLIKNNN